MRAYVVWGVSTLYVVYQFSLQVSIGIFAGDLQRDLHAGAAAIAGLTAIFALVYGGMQLPAGILLDRFSPRWLMVGGLACCAAGSLIFSLAPSMAVAVGARVLMSIGASFGFVSSVLLAGRWFEARRFPVFVGITETVGVLGAAGADTLVEWLKPHASWQQTMQGAALVGALLAALAGMVIRDWPPDATASTRAAKRHLWADLAGLAKNHDIMIACVFYFVSLGALLGFSGLWNVPFQQTFDLPMNRIATYTSLIFVGWAAGSSFAGWLASRIGRFRPVLITAVVGQIAVMVLILYTPLLPNAVIWAFRLSLGFFGGMNIIAFALAASRADAHVRGTVMGLVNTCGFLGVTVLQFLPGLLLHPGASHTTGDYIAALSVYLLALGVGLGLLFLLRPEKRHLAEQAGPRSLGPSR